MRLAFVSRMIVQNRFKFELQRMLIRPRNAMIPIQPIARSHSITSKNLGNLLTERQKGLLAEERKLLANLHDVILDLKPEGEEISIMKEIIAQTESSFMLCVVGEFNAGKSTFINAMLGGKFVLEGVLPTTAKINIIRKKVIENEIKKEQYLNQSEDAIHDDIEEIRVPVDWLDEVALVDTPGTNAVLLQHEKLTNRIIPRADLVIFITSAERPFSDSERVFLERIHDWRKKILLVVNKIDILQTDQEKTTVVEFVKKHGALLLGGNIDVFSVSARLALGAKIAARPNHPAAGAGARQWEESGFQNFESHMIKMLSREERVRSKMLSPLGVAEKVAEQSIEIARRRLKLLESDIATLAMVKEQMDEFMKDISREIRYERLAVEKVFLDVIQKGDEFVDKSLVLSNMKVLMNPEKLKEQFEKEGLSYVATRIDALVADMSALVSGRARTQSMAVLDFVALRQGNHARDMIGRIHNDSFEGTRYDLLNKLENVANAIVRTFNRESETEAIANAVTNSLLQVAVLQVGAATAGGLTVAHLLDPTGGLVAATGLAIAGLAWLPVQRSRAKIGFRQNVEVVQKNLDTALREHLDRELHVIHSRIMDGIGPYTRFVRTEKSKAEKSDILLSSLLSRLHSLKIEVANS